MLKQNSLVVTRATEMSKFWKSTHLRDGLTSWKQKEREDKWVICLPFPSVFILRLFPSLVVSSLFPTCPSIITEQFSVSKNENWCRSVFQFSWILQNPSFHYSLLSMSELDKKRWLVYFYSGKCTIFKEGNIVAIGTLNGSFYTVNTNNVQKEKANVFHWQGLLKSRLL